MLSANIVKKEGDYCSMERDHKFVNLLGKEKILNSIDSISDLSGKLGGILILIIGLIIFYEVVLRSLGRPTTWALEIAEALVLWASFIALSYTFKEGGHIIVDIVMHRVSGKIYKICSKFKYLFMITYITILFVKGYQLVLHSIKSGERIPSVLGTPLWIIQASIPVGSLLLLLQVLRSIISEWKSGGKNIIEKGSIIADRIAVISIIILILGFVSIIAYSKYIVGVNIFLMMMILIFPFLLIGLPVGFTLGILGSYGLCLVLGSSTGMVQIPIIAWRSISEYVLIAVPLFIMCSTLFLVSGIGSDLFSFASLWVRHFSGGLAISAIGACAIFAAITGSSVACAATIGLVAIPELLKAGYEKKHVLGTLAAGGTLGIMIPPSIPFIVYGLLTTQSIGKLFIAGVIPGVMLATVFSIYTFLRHKYFVQTTIRMPPSPWVDRFRGFVSSVWGLLGPVIILGGIYSGIFTPTEAAGIAVVYGLFVLIIIRRRSKHLFKVLLDTVKTTSMIMIIIVGAMLMGQTITLLKLPEKIANFFVSGGSGILFNKFVIIAIINIILLILGCFLEIISILLITIPIFYPVIVGLGFDPIWFGVVVTLNMELAAITPPVGLNLYVIMGLYKDKLEEVGQGVLPYIILMVLFIIVLILWQDIPLWLPRMMKF